MTACPSTSLRLLYVLENYWPHVGGVENAFKTLCERMADRGHRVTVLTHRPEGSPSRERVGGVDIQRVNCHQSRYLFTFAASVEAARLAQEAHVIHATTYNAAPPAWLAGLLTCKPVLLTVNETWIGQWHKYTNFPPTKAAVHDLLERTIFSLPFQRYIGISQSTSRRLAELFPRRHDRMGTIYYGFDPAPWAAPTDRIAMRRQLGIEDRFVILGYGRPGTSKGFEYLVAAFPLIVRDIPNATLVLILSDATQYARELKTLKRMASPDVRFISPRSFAELPAYVRAADCIAVPSVVEGFGYTTLEGVAAGIPVVASNTSSIPEVIGGRYRLVRRRDPVALAAGIVDVFRGRVDVRPPPRFDWDETLEQYEREYYELLKVSRVVERPTLARGRTSSRTLPR